MEFKNSKVWRICCVTNPFIHFSAFQSGKKRVLFDVMKDGSNVVTKQVPPEDQQEPNESRRLWRGLTRAIMSKDMEAATNAKTAVEDAQREERRRLEESGAKHVPRFFQQRDGQWVPNLMYDFLCLFISMLKLSQCPLRSADRNGGRAGLDMGLATIIYKFQII
jgi:hypothetical protein